MVNFETSATGSIPPSADEFVLEVPGCERKLRQQRIQRLRERIESGQYRISAADLADAILRAARQAN